jgi:hypothetical protein
MRRWLVRLLIGAVLIVSWPAPSPTHSTNTIAEVVGDLASADRIAIIVPGVATTPGNFDSGLGGVIRRSPSWQAKQLYAATSGQLSAATTAATVAPTGARVAVVAWLGYDPPSGIDLAAIRSDRAVAGARALVRFVNGLAGEHPGAAITLIGHSYGALVLAYAAAGLPTQVTNLVALGSPGMDLDRAGQLPTHARLWVGSADGDWTRWLPDLRLLGLGHGTNPDRPWFGAQHLNVAGAHGHDGYFVPGTASLRSLAAVTLGTAAVSR